MAGHTTESKTERMLTIYHRLYSGEVVRKQEIAELFQVNARSVQRDIRMDYGKPGNPEPVKRMVRPVGIMFFE